MEIFIGWLNEKLKEPDYDKVKLAAQSHILFETIHPFKDGNGRTGRILLSFILVGCGYVNIAIKGTQKNDRDKYYDSMETGDKQFELLLRKVESGKKITVKEINNYARQSNITLLYEIITNRLQDGIKRLSKKEFVEMNQDATVPLRDAAKFFNYSQDYLRNLINKGKLPAQKRGKLWYLKIRDVEKYMKDLS
jgi:excisionase family DNA binding protein